MVYTGKAERGILLFLFQKGLNIRILKLKPNNVFLDILDYAFIHSIPIKKTKDYQILEKMK